MSERRWTAADFDYSLPPELIAQAPTPERGASRLLVVRRGRIGTGSATPPSPTSPRLIPPGDLLVVNTTRVRHARLLGTRPSGGPAEVLLIHPGADDTWIAMGTPGSAMQPGKRIRLGDDVAVETVAGARRRNASHPFHRRHRRRGDRALRPDSAAAVHRSRTDRTTTSAATRPSTPTAKGASRRRPPACTSPSHSWRRSDPAACASPRWISRSVPAHFGRWRTAR